MGYSYIKNTWTDYNKNVSIDEQRTAIVTVGKLNKMEQGIASPTIEYIDSKAKFGEATYGIVNDNTTDGTRSIDITYKDTINDNTPSKIGTYSAKYIKNVSDTANNITTILNKASGSYSTLEDRLTHIESAIENIKYKRYGVKWNGLSGSRTYDAVGMIANIGTDQIDAYNDFDRIYPWRDIRRCKGYPNTTGTFSILAYSNDHEYNNLNNYDVWVEIPKFYYYRSNTETIISQYKINDNYILPSKFTLGNGKELDKVYIAAYRLSYFNNIAMSRPNMPPITTENTADFRSVYYNGEQQYANIMDKSWGVLYQICTEKGTQYSGLTLEDYEIIYVLATVEFATKDLSSIMKGAVHINVKDEIILSNYGKIIYKVDQNKICMDDNAVNEFFKLSNNIISNLCKNNEKYFTIKINIKETTDIDGQIITNYTPFYRTIIDYSVIEDEDGLNHVFTFSENIKDFIPLDACVKYSYIQNNDEIEMVFLFDENISISLDVYSNGCTDNIITPSGSIIDNTSGYYPCRYRYIEQPWGNQRDALYQIKGSKETNTLSYIYKKDISEDISDEVIDQTIYNTTITSNGNYNMSYNNSPFILPTGSGNESSITINSVNAENSSALPIYVGVDIGSGSDSLGFTTFSIGDIPNATDNDNINNAISTRLSYVFK